MRLHRLFNGLRASYLALPLLVLIVGGVGSVLLAAQVQRVSAAKDAERFQNAVAQTEDGIQARLETYVAILRAGAGFVASYDGRVGPNKFARYVDQLDLSTRYPGIQGVGFSAVLPGRDSNAVQVALASYGAPNLRVYPPGVRDQVHAIIYLEPHDRRNQVALGYDMFSEPVRRVAMERARDTGRPAGSGRVQLVQEIDEVKQAGFLIYMPVYAGSWTPEDVDARRQKLLGFVYSPFRADDLMRGIFGTAQRLRLHLDIYDGAPSTATLLHSSPGRRSKSSFITTRSIDVAGRTWTIVYATRREFDLSSSRGFAPFVLFGGLGVTVMLAVATLLQGMARRRADEAAKRLRSHAHELEVLHQTAGQLAAELDRERLVQNVTDAGRELSGAEIGAFFYNVVNEKGEAYLLYTLSGAPREAFAKLGMPRNTALFGPTFRGEAPVRADDITKDARFGRNEPLKGFPPGHWPVRSYLAVPVVSRSGQVLGALFFGHSQTGKFSEQVERSVVALAGHAAIAIDNAQLFEAAQDEIAARKAIEGHQQLLLGELNHRVKNTLSIIQSIAAQTRRSSTSLEEFEEAFEARLIALSETHNLLSREHWRGVTLSNLVARELAPFGLNEGDRIDVHGGPVWLPPALAVALGMALHELATNAARHGALSSENGRVHVGWDISSTPNGPGLRLVWEEAGGPAVEEPRRRGFGTRMIERGLRHDLRGEAKLYFLPSGVKCVIEASLPWVAEAA